MIVYIRSSLISKDVRVQKYIHFLKENDFFKIQWDRKAEYISNEANTITFNHPGDYGQRMKSIFKFFLWNLFVFKTIFKNRNKIKIIQICDLDSFFGVILFRLFGKKIVFDVYDFFTDSKLSSSGSFCYSALYNVEMFCLQYVDLLILPLSERRKHLNFYPKNMLVCENVPLLTGLHLSEKSTNAKKIEIVYAGTLEEKNRGLEWIPSIANELKHLVNFTIAGDGALASYFKDASNTCANITYLGTITHTKALELQRSADLIYAIYRTNLTNNILAAPNKFYESLFLGTPIVINNGLLISDLISMNDIGFVVEESKDAVIELLVKMNHQKIFQISKTGSEYWSKNYSSYLEKKYNNDYQAQLALLTN